MKPDKKRRLKIQDFIWDYLLINPCRDCGESDLLVLEFDHRDPSLKSFNISDAPQKRLGLKRVLEEINKCDVVCANCHRKRTAFKYHDRKVQKASKQP